ncbi:hypothetical protein AVEN_149098-1 [Araneus ventricosus]|uniref:Uncharacterized protein n=1 Tax=Araneus ventricosus TaxID=182803 RepID=A0A4Y2UKY1_ARAVE|nr:hypothetical protein AVEN_149098-1 [Araneus ventricosus]
MSGRETVLYLTLHYDTPLTPEIKNLRFVVWIGVRRNFIEKRKITDRKSTEESFVNDASMIVRNCVKTSVANGDKSFERELLMLVVNKITDFIPNKAINVDVDVSEFVSLADHSFNVPDKIDMLLGAEIFMNC